MQLTRRNCLTSARWRAAVKPLPTVLGLSVTDRAFTKTFGIIVIFVIRSLPRQNPCAITSLPFTTDAFGTVAAGVGRDFRNQFTYKLT